MTSLSHLLTYLRARFDRDQTGATMVEYGLMVALVAIVAMIAIGPMGNTLADLFGDADNALQNPAPANP